MEEYSLVIRFKNLGTDNSIQEHNNIIERKGYVWGGWWAHSDEQLPLDKIAILQSISLERTVTFFLVNSETNDIYPIIVSDIKFSHDRKKSHRQKRNILLIIIKSIHCCYGLKLFQYSK